MGRVSPLHITPSTFDYDEELTPSGAIVRSFNSAASARRSLEEFAHRFDGELLRWFSEYD